MDDPDSSGLRAWRQLVQHFGPRSGADRSVAYSKIANPVLPQGRPKISETVLAAMQVSDVEAQFNEKSRRILAWKSLMLEVMFGVGAVFTGGAYNEFGKLRKAVIDYIEDKSVLNIKPIRVDLGTVNANEETNIKKKDEEEVRTEEELIALVKQSRAAGASGRSSSKMPDQSSKVCWRCGKRGHISATCRTTNATSSFSIENRLGQESREDGDTGSGINDEAQTTWTKGGTVDGGWLGRVSTILHITLRCIPHSTSASFVSLPPWPCSWRDALCSQVCCRGNGWQAINPRCPGCLL